MRTLVVILAIVLASAAEACTTFCARGLFGRNYDFEIGYGMVVNNKRDVHKSSEAAKPAVWTSRFGSITFNQFGRDNPTGGMNEKGLVVELMWLDGSEYPEADTRGEVGGLEWIQYQLDTAATVGEVLASESKVRISRRSAPLHYLVADAAGEVAAIEFLKGRMVVHRGASVLANDQYETSRRLLKSGASGGDRFVRASRGLAGATTIDAAFALLDDVAQSHTQWSIVYDIRNAAIHWRTAANRERRSVKFAAFDFRCSTPVLISDVDANTFTPYTRTANAALVRRSTLGTSFLRDTPESELQVTAGWPERSTCGRISQ
jgi:penicillin V acylase-like amidase (Ntn superfamily)